MDTETILILLFGAFLPGLLFEASFHIEFKQFQRSRLTIDALVKSPILAILDDVNY